MKRINGNTIGEITDMAYADLMFGSCITKALFIDMRQKNFLILKARHNTGADTETFSKYNEMSHYRHIGNYTKLAEKDTIKADIEETIRELMYNGKVKTSWPVYMMKNEEAE